MVSEYSLKNLKERNKEKYDCVFLNVIEKYNTVINTGSNFFTREFTDFILRNHVRFQNYRNFLFRRIFFNREKEKNKQKSISFFNFDQENESVNSYFSIN